MSRLIEEALSLNSHSFMSKEDDYIIVRKSKIEGVGLFANIDLNKDLDIGIAFEVIDDTGDPDKDIERTTIGRVVNHSSTPNLYLVKRENAYHFLTKQAIDANEELTFDYREFPWDGKRDFTKEV